LQQPVKLAGPPGPTKAKNTIATSRQTGGGPVEIFNDQRPSALPGVCAQVPGASGPSPTASAHGFAVGRPAARGGWITEVQYLMIPQQIQVQGRTASDALTVQGNGVVAAKRDLGDVRGLRPRGRPV
jgi:hypothetical protein